MTGMSGVVAELSSKLVEFVRDLLPLAHKVAVLANAPHPFSTRFLEQRRLAGSATGVEMDPVRPRPKYVPYGPCKQLESQALNSTPHRENRCLLGKVPPLIVARPETAERPVGQHFRLSVGYATNSTRAANCRMRQSHHRTSP